MPDVENVQTLPGSNGAIDARLRRHLPKEGWLSRQEQISSLQTAFNRKPVILLYGENGGGKTTSAAAFASQEAEEGLLQGQPVIYSSFQEFDNLTDLMESFGQVYEIALLERNIDWRTLDDFQRLKLIEDLLKKVPLLWIWDDFELVSSKTSRYWRLEDRQQLVDLLQSIPQGGGRILILSEEQEQALLGTVPERVKIHLECQNVLSEKIASKLDPQSRIPQLELHKVLQHVYSLFSEEEQQILCLTGLFKGILSLDILCGMFDEKNPWKMASSTGWKRENIKQVLDQASEFQLYSPISTTGYYLLHPAVTGWLVKNLTSNILNHARRAFTHSMADFARRSVSLLNDGHQEVIELFAVHEANLRLSLALADRFRWRGVILDLLAASRPVFLNSRRYAAWNRLLDQVSWHFIHPETLQPVSHKDRLAREYLAFQVDISLKRDRFNQAARWQSLIVSSDRKQKTGPGKTGSRGAITPLKNRELVISLTTLGDIFRQTGSPKSIEAFTEAFQIARDIQLNQLAGDISCKIAEAYIAIPVAQNFDHAETWIKTGMDLVGDQDDLLYSRLIALQGKTAYEKFMKARKENQPSDQQVSLLNQALKKYFQALEQVPDKAYLEQAELHEMIGLLYLQSEGMLETAVEFYDMAIDEMNQAGYRAGAARASFNLAVPLFLLNDFARSRKYAQAALHTFEEIGMEAIIDAEKTRKFLNRFPA